MSTVRYEDLVNRNFGLLDHTQQQRLKDARIAVLGVGGLGGVIAEILTRCGVGTLKILDRDCFESTNLNRQIFAFINTLNRNKVEVTAEFLRQINPQLQIETHDTVDEANVETITNGVDVVVLALDDAKSSIIVARHARENGIPVVEGHALPYGCVRVFTEQTPSFEEAYRFPTIGKKTESISETLSAALDLQILDDLKRIDGIEHYYPQEAIERILTGEIPSFAPMVWLSAILMATESIKLILELGKPALAPSFTLYDPYSLTIPTQAPVPKIPSDKKCSRIRLRKASLADIPAIILLKEQLPLSRHKKESSTGGFLIDNTLQEYMAFIQHGHTLLLEDTVENNLLGYAIALPDKLLRQSKNWRMNENIHWKDFDPSKLLNEKICLIEQVAVAPRRGTSYAPLLAGRLVCDLFSQNHQHMLSSVLSHPVKNRAVVPLMKRFGFRAVGEIAFNHPVVGDMRSELFYVSKEKFDTYGVETKMQNYPKWKEPLEEYLNNPDG